MMPLFAYRCTACDHEFEELVSGDEAVSCPTCESAEHERLIGVTAAPRSSSLPIAGCPPSDAPPCSPSCCRLP